MKRNTTKVEKRTFTLKNAFPTFVSLVNRGANFIPLAELRYSDTNKFSDVEINRMEFSKANFTHDKVDAYLRENEYVDYSIEETEDSFVVPGLEDSRFEEVSAVEYADGLKIFVGKLKSEVEDNQPAAEVTNGEGLDFADPENVEVSETVQESDLNVEAVADLVAEVVTESEVPAGDLEADLANPNEIEGDKPELVAESDSTETVVEQVQENQEEVTNEEANATEQESASEESQAEFAAAEKEQEEKVKRYEQAKAAADALMTTEKYSGGFGSFREQFDEYRARGLPVSYDTITWIFSDANYYAMLENDLEQFRKNCNDFYSAVVAIINAQKNLSYSDVAIEEESEPEAFEMTKDEVVALFTELFEAKVAETKEVEQEVVDETEIVVQNSQASQEQEEIHTEATNKDAKVEKFNQRKNYDLFGI